MAWEWPRGGQGLDTEPSHRGQEEDKAWTSQGLWGWKSGPYRQGPDLGLLLGRSRLSSSTYKTCCNKQGPEEVGGCEQRQGLDTEHSAKPQSSGARSREKVSRTFSNDPHKRWPEIAFLAPKTPSPGHLFKRWLGSGQEEDKAWTQSPATEDKGRTRPGHRAQPQRTRGGQGLNTEHRAKPQSSGARPREKVCRTLSKVA